MKITFKGDYALKAVLDLALHYNQELVTGHDLAQRIDAPVKFLEQVLLDLRKGGFIESRRGNIGGYMLSRTPDKITVGEVVRYIDGPLEPISCVKEGYSNCKEINKCVFKKMWQRVSQATSDIIDNVTFEELASQVNSGEQALAYFI
ncbi:MAG TPA: Rrf2 family transcriptional regulator [Candidatus Margulisiibacteriota bacterium]|nr:Rrf2 family transcriptional regulator [Candidatus Margulisiibacteriota bacterium]